MGTSQRLLHHAVNVVKNMQCQQTVVFRSHIRYNQLLVQVPIL